MVIIVYQEKNSTESIMMPFKGFIIYSAIELTLV